MAVAEILQRGQFNSAMELLCGNVTPDVAHIIVQETISGNQLQHLVDLLQCDRIDQQVRHTILNAAKECAGENVFLHLLQASKPTQQELKDVLVSALRKPHTDLILQFLSSFRTSRRIFIQLLPNIKLKSSDVVTLSESLWNQEPELAFHVYVAQQMWDKVIAMYKDPCLPSTARRFALRHAISKQAWVCVCKMARVCVTRLSDHRHAFLQAARSGQWRTAVKISSRRGRISLSDMVFALSTWFSMNLYECVPHVSLKWGGDSQLARCIAEQCIAAEQFGLFEKIWVGKRLGEMSEMTVIELALEHNKGNFIIQFCQLLLRPHIMLSTLQLAIENKNWQCANVLIDNYEERCDSWDDEDERLWVKMFILYLDDVLFKKDAWTTVVPTLNSFCHSYSLRNLEDSDDLIDHFNTFCRSNTELMEFCLENQHGYLALLLAALSDNEDNVERAVNQKCLLTKGNVLSSDLISFCILAFRNGDWDSVVVILQHMAQDDAESTVSEELYGANFECVINACRCRDLFELAINVGVWSESWDNVSEDLYDCQDTEIIDKVIQKAARSGEWDIVLSSLSRCSQDPPVLCNVLNWAVESGKSDCCELLLEKVNPTLAPWYNQFHQPLLFKAVTSSGNREEMVIVCIKAGLSTYRLSDSRQDAGDSSVISPMTTAARNGQLPLIKLLHQAGAYTNKELHTLHCDHTIRTLLNSQGRQDIVDYLDFMVKSPPSLQHLCRLAVSHHVGCQPGRPERIASLSVPSHVQDFIHFTDVLS